MWAASLKYEVWSICGMVIYGIFLVCKLKWVRRCGRGGD